MDSRKTLVLTLVAVVCAPWVAAQDPAATPIPDRELSLAKGSVFDLLVPPVAAVNSSDPGDQPTVDRAFDTAPPLVPHTVVDFMPITRSDNWCVDCHMTDWTAPEEGEATPIPFSHYMDLRSDSDAIGEAIAGSRWVCVSCHVAVTDAPALVGSTFEP